MAGQAIEAVLFDLGGVVFNIDFDRVFAEWAQASGSDLEAIRERYSFDDAYEAHERGEISGPQYYHALRTMLGVAITDAQFEVGWNAIFLDAVEGIDQVLATLTVPAFAFSNTNATHERVWQSRYPHVLARFQSVFVSSRIGLRKPEPEAFAHVLGAMGHAPESVLFLDDTHANVVGARASGLHARAVGSIEETRASLREFGLIAPD
ncbi:MAG: HAD family phosphatase [Pseudomonadota bacterium]